jgi:hypothetical protein
MTLMNGKGTKLDPVEYNAETADTKHFVHFPMGIMLGVTLI